MHKELLYDLYSSTNVIRLISSRRMSWLGHVALGGGEIAYSVLVGRPDGN